MAETVQQLFQDALTYIGLNTPSGVVGADILNLCLRAGNRLLDSWSAEKLAMAGLKYATYPLTGDSSYTLGPAGTFNTTRPMKIKSASTIDALGLVAIAKVVPAEVFDAISDQTRTGLYVEDLTYDNGFPLMTLRVTPMPAAGTLGLWTYEQFTQFANLTDALILAPGYEDPLLLCLAERFSLAFQRAVPPAIATAALQSKHVIASLSAEILGLSPPGVPPPMVAPAAQAPPGE